MYRGLDKKIIDHCDVISMFFGSFKILSEDWNNKRKCWNIE